MRSRQQLLRTLIAEIIADYDHSVREIVLKIHWRGGQHSELRVPKLDPENMASELLTKLLP